jgi:hypothetical protein
VTTADGILKAPVSDSDLCFQAVVMQRRCCENSSKDRSASCEPSHQLNQAVGIELSFGKVLKFISANGDLDQVPSNLTVVTTTYG